MSTDLLELRARMGAASHTGRVCHMGGTWCVPYGSHVHQIGAIWESYCTTWKEDGAIQESHMPYGSHIHQTRAAGTVWESDCTIWEPHMTYEGHMRAVCTVWVLRAPYWRHMVPYGSLMHCVGTMREPCAQMLEPCVSYRRHVRARWEAIGTIWELHDSHGSHMVAIWMCMGAMCDI
jgi:hypothetical protein